MNSHIENIIISPPKEFNYNQCMVYLSRSNDESTHKTINNKLYKLIKYNDTLILCCIENIDSRLRISFLNTCPTEKAKEYVKHYVWNLFDFNTDLKAFYSFALGDDVLSILVDRYRGLRIIKIDNMFEGICWAIIGQQINLKFAYTLKKRLVEKYGEKLSHEDIDYFIFPDPNKIAQLDVKELRELQFTQRKSEYIIGVAELFRTNAISKQKLLLEKDYQGIHNTLTAIRGIGSWTADYSILKCMSINTAFPIADVGIHNGLKLLLNRDEKPSIEEIKKMADKWKGWESYATFYIWRCLYDY